jgi:chromosome segregation ATPase
VLSEKEGLMEQLSLDKQTAQLETEQLGDKIREQDRKIHSLTVERDLLQNKASSAKETIKKLEEQITTSSTNLYTAQAGERRRYVLAFVKCGFCYVCCGAGYFSI